MLVKTFAAAVQGVEAQKIVVEVNAGGTVPAGKQMFFLVGLPDKAVSEGFQRMEAAIKNIGYKMPRLKLVVNLCLLYTSPSPRDQRGSRMPSSA